MAGKIKVIIKRPDELYGHVTNISSSLENLQKTVGGYIEAVGIGEGMVILCNEEGKIRQLPYNIRVGTPSLIVDIICGDLIVVGADGEEFTDVPIDFQTWKRLLVNWGNY